MSVLGIFQHIWVPQFPAMHPRLHLVLRLKGKRTEVGEHQVQIKLMDDADTELLGGSGTVNFAEPPAGVTEIEAAAVLVFDVPFPHAGQCCCSPPCWHSDSTSGDIRCSTPTRGATRKSRARWRKRTTTCSPSSTACPTSTSRSCISPLPRSP